MVGSRDDRVKLSTCLLVGWSRRKAYVEIVKKKEGFDKMQMNKYVSQKVEYERLTGDFLWWHLGNPLAI